MFSLSSDGQLFSYLPDVRIVGSFRPEKYGVDRDNIKNMARDLQMEFHPDKSASESELKEKM